LPYDLKVNGSKLKFVLRELMRDKLPQSVLTRSKQGFDIPTHHWFRTILKPLLLETLNRESVESSGLFQWPAVQRAISDHLERRANYGYHLWGLLTLFLWRKRWAIGTR
jgi:asparagine synthase (glutamine-hydrolysing)